MLHLCHTTPDLIFFAPPAKARALSYQEDGMSNVDGKWDCSVASPMGDQDFVLSVTSAGDRFSGSAEGSIGAKDIPDGTVDGDTIAWSMRVSNPMAITLTCRATISGDILEGSVKAGFFGTFPITGKRAG
jgi:hypothetical protein